MNLIKILIIGGVALLSACSSMTVTYDAAGNVLGSCKATRGLLSTASAHCSGHGNGPSVDYSAVDQETGRLPTPPQITSISIR